MKRGRNVEPKGEKMRTVKDNGSYTSKKSGQEVGYSFEFTVLDTVEDMASAEVLALANRMLKVDANNKAREKTKSDNGDSTARILTAEEKAERKEQRQKDSADLKAIRALALSQGRSIAEVLADLA